MKQIVEQAVRRVQRFTNTLSTTKSKSRDLDFAGGV